MPSDFKLSTAARNAAVNAVAGLVDVSPPGWLQVYDDGDGAGIPPINSAPTVQNLLCGFSLQTPGFNAAVNGAATLKALTPSTTSDGVAAFFRFVNSAGQAVLQGTVGEAADAPVDMQLNTKTLVLNGSLAISDFTLTIPS